MHSTQPPFPGTTGVVLKRSLFFVALGLIGAAIAWLVDRANFAASAIVFGLGIYCLASAFLPFQICVNDHDEYSHRLALRIFVFLEVSLLVAVAYVVTIGTVWYFDRPIFDWLSNDKHFYIAYPACVFALIVVLMTITALWSNLWRSKR